MNNEKNTKIIVFEGLDCTYKETNSNELFHFLANKFIDNKNIRIDVGDFPHYKSKSSYFVDQYLHGKYSKSPIFTEGKSDIDDLYELQVVTNMYLLDMFDWWTRRQSEKEYDKRYFILDRWFYSMMYYLDKNINSKYQLENRMIRSEELFYMATEMYKLPKADILIKMINNSSSVSERSLQRAKELGQEKLDKYEEDDFFMSKVKENFNTLDFSLFISGNSDKDRVLEIDVTDRTREDISDEICKKVDDLLCTMEKE